MRVVRACLRDLRYIRYFTLLVSTISTALCDHWLLGSALLSALLGLLSRVEQEFYKEIAL